MNRKTLFIQIANALLLTALLSACSSTAVHAPATMDIASCPPKSGIALSLNEAVLYYTCIGSLPVPDLATEYTTTMQSYSKTGRDSDRIRLAMLLSMPDTAFHNTAEALKLLESFPGKPAPPPTAEPALYNLARMLNMILVEQRRENDTLNDLAKALAAERAHSEFLQGKIDAIKNLEINMIHRDQP
jgi:hypothetical protein